MDEEQLKEKFKADKVALDKLRLRPEQWAWEFLRRWQVYKDSYFKIEYSYKNAFSEIFSKHGQISLGWKQLPEAEAFNSFGLTTPLHPDHPASRISHTSWDSSLLLSIGMVEDLTKWVSDGQLRKTIDVEHERVIKFDLRMGPKNLKRCLKKIEAELSREMPEQETRGKPKPHSYPLYVLVYDMKQAGFKPNDIAAFVNTNLISYARYNYEDHIREAEKKIEKGGYKKLVRDSAVF